MSAAVGSGALDPPRVAEGLEQIDIDGERVIWDSRRRRVHRLNRTAAAILDRCNGVRTLDDLTDDVARAFSTDRATVAAEVVETVAEFDRASLLSTAAVPPVDMPDHRVPAERASARRARELVDERPWPFRTPALRAFAFDFVVVADNPDVVTFLSDALSGFPAGTSSRPHLYSIREKRGAKVQWRLSLDGTPLMQDRRLAAAVDHLLWHLNRMAVDSMDDAVVLHAGAAQLDGGTVLLAGDPDSGKSTLVAGLCERGARYLTDEAVAVSPGSGLLTPYPKPITLQSGSWAAVPDLRRLAVSPPGSPGASSQVPSARLPGGVVNRPTHAALIVLPTYAPGARTVVRPMSRGAALAELLRHTFDFADLGQRGLDGLADLVRATPAYAMELDDLDSAWTTIASLLDRG